MSFSLPPSSQKTFNQSLREKGLRPTKQRACVYAVILDKKDHPTADDIFDRVKKQLPGTSFATVYNCLQTLVGADLSGKFTWTVPLPAIALTFLRMLISSARTQERFMIYKLMMLLLHK